MEYKFLNKINSPDDLRKIDDKDIPLLAEEIRHFLVGAANQHGGHLASNLGIVEITLAIHKVFDSPRDHIIFDVGHQAYVHKMITGRRDGFENLRKPGGLYYALNLPLRFCSRTRRSAIMAMNSLLVGLPLMLETVYPKKR